jgi:protein phosphatase
MTAPQLRWGAATDVGRVRGHNEDSMLVEPTVFVVADGMGGHAAGEVASGLAVDTLREVAHLPELTSDDIVAALAEANERILRSVESHPQQAGMGTTVTGLAVVTHEGFRRWAVFNVGDSRVYRYADGELSQVTVDHSEVQELVDAGLISPEAAARHPLRNLLTRALGSEDLSQVDLWELPLQPGDCWLVCSDGLTGELDDAEVARFLGSADDPQRTAEALVAAAVDAGGHDNVTAVVVCVD